MLGCSWRCCLVRLDRFLGPFLFRRAHHYLDHAPLLTWSLLSGTSLTSIVRGDTLLLSRLNHRSLPIQTFCKDCRNELRPLCQLPQQCGAYTSSSNNQTFVGYDMPNYKYNLLNTVPILYDAAILSFELEVFAESDSSCKASVILLRYKDLGIRSYSNDHTTTSSVHHYYNKSRYSL